MKPCTVFWVAVGITAVIGVWAYRTCGKAKVVTDG